MRRNVIAAADARRDPAGGRPMGEAVSYLTVSGEIGIHPFATDRKGYRP